MLLSWAKDLDVGHRGTQSFYSDTTAISAKFVRYSVRFAAALLVLESGDSSGPGGARQPIGMGRSVARVLPCEFRFPRQDLAVGRYQRCLVLQGGRHNETIGGIAM